MAGTTTVALPVSANWKTALAAAFRRSGDCKYHQRAWVSATNRLRLTTFLHGGVPGLPDALDLLKVLVDCVGQLGEGAPQRGQGGSFIGDGIHRGEPPAGRPLRVMITSSPWSRPLSISLRWAFASLMLYVGMPSITLGSCSCADVTAFYHWLAQRPAGFLGHRSGASPIR